MASANEDSNEHETFIATLEYRWQKLQKQIETREIELEKTKFNDEIEELIKARNEYQIWLDATPASDSQTELQVDN